MLYENATKLYGNASHPANASCNWWSASVPRQSNAWTDLNVLRFLRLYQARTLLWDKAHPDYENRRARTSAYREIAKTLRLRNVDEVECMRLVELLKKRYVEEREFNRDGSAPKPAWFCIISGIVKRILNAREKDDAEEAQKSASFEACEGCCAKQNLTAPCGYYRESPRRSSSTDSSQACQDCCDRQNLPRATCERYGSPRESLAAETRQIDSCAVVKDDLNIVVLDFLPCFAPEEKRNDCDEANPRCDCGASVTTSSCSVDDGSKDKSCDCSSSSKTASTEKSDSESSLRDYCLQDFVKYYRPFTVRPCCNKRNDANEKHSEEEKGANKTPIASQPNDESEKSGLFVDSSRQFRGKKIDLIVARKSVDDQREEIVRVRRHFAADCEAGVDYGEPTQERWYPLQVEM